MGSPEFMLSIVFYTHWGNIRLTNCFCWIARIAYVALPVGTSKRRDRNCRTESVHFPCKNNAIVDKMLFSGVPRIVRG